MSSALLTYGVEDQLLDDGAMTATKWLMARRRNGCNRMDRSGFMRSSLKVAGDGLQDWERHLMEKL